MRRGNPARMLISRNPRKLFDEQALICLKTRHHCRQKSFGNQFIEIKGMSRLVGEKNEKACLGTAVFLSKWVNCIKGSKEACRKGNEILV